MYKLKAIVLMNFLCLSLVSLASSQVILLKSGNINVEKQSINEVAKFIENNPSSHAILTFKTIPSDEMKSIIEGLGIHLVSYLPKNSFYVFLDKKVEVGSISKLDIHSLIPISEEIKIHPLINGRLPEWSLNGDKVNLIVSFFGESSEFAMRLKLSNNKAQVLSIDEDGKRAFIQLPKENIQMLADFDFIYFVEPIDAPGQPENYGARSQHRSNMLAQEFNSGNKYDGTGISIGMHDDGIIGPHIDYEGRLPIQFPSGNSGNHGDHVAGTIMGAGNLDPKGRGMAYGADLYVYGSSNNNYDDAPAHYATYDVIITSKSYSNGCNAGYTSLTRKLDQQSRQLPSLIHVFSAGNDGNSNCGYGAGSGWGNITGGHKMGKNVIATGNLTGGDQIAGSSSRGPADDGRIKPDICAKGSSVYSTIDENDYGLKTGTSMSCPGISGSLGQLYHAYKSLNANQNPPSALIKGIVLNTADDLGNPGPDFKYGWGRINLRRALNVLENSQYISFNIVHLGNTVHPISVPPGVKEFRVMVYWHDFEATTSASRALVNDLDIVLADPSNTTYLPWVLDPTPNVSALNSNAVRAVDSLNNMEQVSLDNPVAGTYNLYVTGSNVPQGPQDYYVIYEYTFDEIYLTYPNGGEGLSPFETEVIRWDASASTSTFDIEYSTDGGNSWSTAVSNVSANARQINWNVPNIVTDQAKIRITRGLVSDESDANFTVVRVPQNLSIDWVCPDSMKLSWNAVSSATDYRTYMLGNKYMDSISTTSNTSYVYANTIPNEQYWVSVSANAGPGYTGRRAIAIQSPSGTFNCPLNQDFAIGQVVSPNNGTYLSCILDTVNLELYVKNVGTNPISNPNVACKVYNSGIIQGNVVNSIAPGDSVLITFGGTKIDLASALNTIECYILNGADQNPYNDSVNIKIDYATGSLYNAPWEEDFEGFLICGTDNDCGDTDCPVFNDWTQDESFVIDDHDWRTDIDGTASGQTGPSFDHNPGTAFGKYLYLEASSGCNYKVAQLLTPCLDLTEMSLPSFTFYYHMYGVEMGELHIDLLTENGWVMDVINPKAGNVGDIWLEESIDLSPYTGGVVSVRFRGITGSDYRSDMAIDDIALIETDPYIGISENIKEHNIRIYPNPSKDLVSINLEETDLSNVKFHLTDASGKLVDIHINALNKEVFTLDLAGLESGLYFLEIQSNETTFVEKLIKL